MASEIQNMEQTSGMELLYSSIRSILDKARKRAYSAVNYAMVESYWKIGQSIVENEQARLWYMNKAADEVWSTRQM